MPGDQERHATESPLPVRPPIPAPAGFATERPETATAWLEALLQPLCLTTVVTSFLVGVIQFGLSLFPTWNTLLLIPTIAVAVLAGYLYSRHGMHGSIQWKEILLLLVPLLLVVLLAPYLEWGLARLIADVQHWVIVPEDMLDIASLVKMLLVGLGWKMGFDATQTLNALYPLPDELPPTDSTSSAYAEWVFSPSRKLDRSIPVQTLTSHWLWGGGILLLVGAATSSGVRQLLGAQALLQLVTFARPARSAVYFNIILYFVAGLLLISLAQFTRLRATWSVEQVTVVPTITRRWVLLLVSFVALTLLIALLMPTEPTTGLQTVVRDTLVLLSQFGTVLAWIWVHLFGTGMIGGPGLPAPQPSSPGCTVCPAPSKVPPDLLSPLLLWGYWWV